MTLLKQNVYLVLVTWKQKLWHSLLYVETLVCFRTTFCIEASQTYFKRTIFFILYYLQNKVSRG